MGDGDEFKDRVYIADVGGHAYATYWSQSKKIK